MKDKGDSEEPTRKRKASSGSPEDRGSPTSSGGPRTKSRKKGKNVVSSEDSWPEYFKDLFKIYKALNTVIAFCSSRKHLAITFSVIRTSVEALLKHPLDLNKVAEIKALLPDLIKFGYMPKADLLINENTEAALSRRPPSPDYATFLRAGQSKPTATEHEDEEEHVLVLDFTTKVGGKKAANPAMAISLPPALTPQQVQKLIEKRNERFVQAVNELFQATPSDEDPVEIVKAAARKHIPIDPTKPMANFKKGSHLYVPTPEERLPIPDIITELRNEDWYHGQMTYRKIMSGREAQLGTLEDPLPENIKLALQDARKIGSFYGHQAAAINALGRGRHVIVSTSTASGKSVIYQVPMLRFLVEDADSKAIYIYPTKALAQDQRLALEQLLVACPGLEHTKIATYDGDTPRDLRPRIRDTASVIFTNFDMLHMSILPQEEHWRTFLQNLKLVAVDELHYYTGLFGSHVAQVMRRFRRICAAVGNNAVRFVSCSATIANPLKHMQDIFGVEDIEVVTEDGAPAGSKEFLVWDPPRSDPNDETSSKVGTISEATRLMTFLMKNGIRTILFCKIRKSCELAMKALRADLSSAGRVDILQKVMAYRGGYSQQDRRKIEHEAFSGNLLGIVATNALELGVDIGALDAVIMMGFPFGLANLRQQSGRAGRRGRDALSVLVVDQLPLDRHYAEYPEELFEKPVNDLVVDLHNKVILEAHLQCAAMEMPLCQDDASYFGEEFQEICDKCLSKDREGWYHTHAKYMPWPAKHVSIRGIQEEYYTVVDVTRVSQGGQPRVLEEIEVSRAIFETYEGAVFIHQGLTFIVKEVSHDSKMARLIRADVNWITRPRDFTDADATHTYRIREIKASAVRAFFGRVDLTTTVFGYFKVRNNQILDAVDLEMLPFERTTTGMWIDVPTSTLDILKLKGINAAESIHAAEHAFLNRFAMAADVKTECKVPKKEYMIAESKRKRPARLIFWDSAGTDGGIAAKAFDHVSDLIHEASEILDSCECEEGCAKCICSPYCKEGNVVSSKLGAQLVIKGILGLPIDVDAIPDPLDEYDQAHDTIIAAQPVRATEGIEVELYVDG